MNVETWTRPSARPGLHVVGICVEYCNASFIVFGMMGDFVFRVVTYTTIVLCYCSNLSDQVSDGFSFLFFCVRVRLGVIA